MTNQELYRDAILEAKAIRETALAAAKETIAEAFEPRIKEMMRLKLSEEADMEEAGMDEMPTEATEHGMEEATLDEILAELDGLSEDSEPAEEGINEAEEDQEEADEEMSADADASIDADAGMEDDQEGSDDEQVVDITVGELKDIFRDVFAQLQGTTAPEAGAAPETAKDDEISLEEILAELEMEEGAQVPGTHDATDTADVTSIEEKMKMKKELEEANKAVTTMRAELQEVNLLNAKLLYVNKLWKGKSLTESQKVKMLNAFDRATTVKEAENIYKTISESAVVAPKRGSMIKESMGFASKAIGSAPARPVAETDSMIARWQHLAGI